MKLTSVIQSGFPISKKDLDPELRPYWNIRDEIFVGLDGVVMYGDRIVFPCHLRESVLHVLHSGHQGVSGMLGRAIQLFFWPNMSNDVLLPVLDSRVLMVLYCNFDDSLPLLEFLKVSPLTEVQNLSHPSLPIFLSCGGFDIECPPRITLNPMVVLRLP